MQPSVVFFFVEDVRLDHVLAPTACRNEVVSRPEASADEVALALPIYLRQITRTLALDVPNHLRRTWAESEASCAVLCM